MEPNDLPIVCIPLELPAEAAAELLEFLGHLTETIERHYFGALHRLAGPRLLRVKGLVLTRATAEKPLFIQGAQHLMHPPRRLYRWPFDPPGTRLVVIVDGVAEAEIAALWRALRGMPDIDRPDLAALTDNPLAPRAGGLFG